MARYVCKNIVAAGLADEIELQVAYAIGVSKPVSVYVNTYGTGKLSDSDISDIIVREFDLRPYAVIETLGLRRPIYSQDRGIRTLRKAQPAVGAHRPARTALKSTCCEPRPWQALKISA